MKYFKTQMNQSFLKHKQNISTAKEKLMWDLFFRFMEAMVGLPYCQFEI